jgi:fatty acid desaturase
VNENGQEERRRNRRRGLAKALYDTGKIILGASVITYGLGGKSPWWVTVLLFLTVLGLYATAYYLDE